MVSVAYRTIDIGRRPPVPVIRVVRPPNGRRPSIQRGVHTLCNLRLRRREAMLHKARRPPVQWKPQETPGTVAVSLFGGVVTRRICGLIKRSGGVHSADGHILRVPRVRRCAPQSEGYFEPLSECKGPYYLRLREITNDSRRRV